MTYLEASGFTGGAIKAEGKRPSDSLVQAIPDDSAISDGEIAEKSSLEKKVKNMLHPVTNAAGVVQRYGAPFGELESIDQLCIQLIAVNQEMQQGDMSRLEDILLGQAHALQSIFTNLALRAAKNMDKHLQATDTLLRLALKAQSQCRSTLETLAEIKNPQPTAFIKQQNIAANQQVNNDAFRRAREKSEKLQNKLSRPKRHER